ncbi:MAG: efflux RND transporter periplasmic adaptor subunit [Ignavibacteria bacterium]|nr:efflux RND transporter periplasmic adaptor subunit [Ignavibacteria bacterium]
MARKKSRKALFITLGVLLLMIVVIAGWYMSAKRDAVVFVSVEPVAKRTIIQTVNAIGKIQPEYMVKISSEASGEIIFLGARDGDTVRRGDLLVRIQPDIMETQLEQYRASADAAKSAIVVAKAEMDRTDADLKRISELYKKEYASREELDKSKAAYQSAAARYTQALADHSRALGALKQTQATASRTTIMSPMEGVVTYLAVEQGEKVVGTAQMQGTEIMRISNLNIMNVWVDVDENDVAVITLGDTARIKVDALADTTYAGVVYEISHSPKTTAAGTQEEVVNFQVRIRLLNPDPRMRPGMSVSADIETETKADVVAVPIQSVTVNRQDNVQQSNGQQSDDNAWRVTERNADARKKAQPKSMVWVVKGSTVESRVIETGISDQGFIEIIKGLTVGEKVVTAPYQAVSKLLTPGAKIRVENSKDRKVRFDRMRQE